MVRAIVTKWDDAYVLRVPKRYIKDNHLRVGDIVAIEEPLILQQNALAAIVRRGKERGPVVKTVEPAEWQRQHRQTNGLRKESGHGPSGQ